MIQNTSNRVARATMELRALSSEICWTTFKNSSPAEQNQILNSLMNGGLVEDLKTTLDHLRHFLWCYIESAATYGTDADYELQSTRLQRVTDMLRLLHGSACPSEDPAAFLERITQSVDREMEVHEPTETELRRAA